MEPTEILSTLKELGITAQVNGDKLVMTPGSRVPAAMVVEIRHRKDEIIALLSSRLEVTSHLLSRLQAGSHWLTAQHEAWLEGKQDAASDDRFSVALAAWGEMEHSLRLVFGYEGCAFGPSRRCPEGAPVVCDFCSERGNK